MQGTTLELVGNDLKFVKAKEFALNIAVTKTPAIVVGEAGTGKRALCELIHANSARRSQEFVIVDCANTSKKVENEILGYRDEETGRFNKGALERCNGGTVVLANIDGLEEEFQKKLYKILTELADYEIDVRILATTTKNLSKFVGAGRFYRALYTFFSGTQILLSPLRDRGADIELLTNYFISAEMVKSGDTEPVVFSPEALEKIKGYYWAHNIQELKAVVENSYANCVNGVIDLGALELGEKKAESNIADLDEDGIRLMSLKEAEKLLIKKALIHTSENRTQAAKILGVSIRTLRNKINEYRGDGASFFVNLR